MVYLLTKGERYFYDKEAARDEAKPSSKSRLSQDIENQEGSSRVQGKVNGNMKAVGGDYANWRDVWTISHSERSPHIAIMPIELARRCIKAGCPVGGTVLDPFAGSGTTGKAAIELNREAILIERNPAFECLIRERLSGTQKQLI
jgi:DNA modification methylase